MAGQLARVMANPTAALERLERGDGQAAMALGNLIGTSVGPGGSAQQMPEMVERYGGQRLLRATLAQLAAARQQRNYVLWRGAALLASNCCRFDGEQGERYRASLLEQGGCCCAGRGRAWLPDRLAVCCPPVACALASCRRPAPEKVPMPAWLQG